MSPEFPATDAFQVDLHGIVDLLARHLYSSPRVYLRELLQNGVDAITARRKQDASAPARIVLRPMEDGGLEVLDTGIGLTVADARELLATIGRSSKRDIELGGGRAEYLGQFGIGLLSAFMVADEIEMVSRKSVGPGRTQPPPVSWRGFSDGSYELTELANDDPAALDLEDGGSIVRLRPRRDTGHWLAPDTVAALAEDFGGLLPVAVSIEVRLADGSTALRRLSRDELPWRTEYGDTADRQAALQAYGERTLGFTPLACIDLDIPIAGLSGVGFVLPAAVTPTAEAHHRVYLKRMLLGTNVSTVLPPWAFFVRCVLDASDLRPTASREGLYEDEILLAAREELGAQVRAWTISLLEAGGPPARRFVEVHSLALRALAVSDDEMLDLGTRVLPFETTAGVGSLTDLRERAGDRPLLYTRTLEEFRRIAPVAAARQIPLINGGYVYDAELLERAARRHPALRLEPADSVDIVQVLDELEPLRQLEIVDAVEGLRGALAEQDCDVLVRRFEPADLSAFLLEDRDGEHARKARAAAADSDDVWGEVLSELTEPARPRRLVLNDASPAVRALLGTSESEVRDAAARSLYVTAVLAAGIPLQAAEASLMNESLSQLIARALRSQGGQAQKGIQQ